MSERQVVLLSGVRTAIGDYGGSLKDIRAERARAPRSCARPSRARRSTRPTSASASSAT